MTRTEKFQKLCELLRRARIIADELGESFIVYLNDVTLEEAESRLRERGPGPMH